MPPFTPAAGSEQTSQARGVDEEHVAEIDHEGTVALAIENRGLENRTSGDIDIAVHDDHAVRAIVDGERILVSHLSQGVPPVG